MSIHKWELDGTAVVIVDGEPITHQSPNPLCPVWVREVIGSNIPIRAYSNTTFSAVPKIHYVIDEGTPVERDECVHVESVDLVGGLIVIPSFFGLGWDIVHWQGSPVADSIGGKENALTLAQQLHNYFNWEWYAGKVKAQINHNPAATNSMLRVIDGYDGRYTSGHHDTPVFPNFLRS